MSRSSPLGFGGPAHVFAPGAALGVLGGGQLGRMFAIAARRMGYRVHSFSPEDDSPTGQIADVEITASYEDLDALRAFAHGVNVVTFEFERIDTASRPALGAPGFPMASVPTGTPPGIWTIESSESRP